MNRNHKILSSYYFKRLMIVVAIILFVIVATVVYKNIKKGLFISSDFKSIREEFISGIEDFESNADMSGFITRWARRECVDFKVDASGNIIFRTAAKGSKTSEDSVVVCISYNYKTAEANADLIASGLYIAQSDIRSTEYTVIFFNNDKGNFDGYKNVSPSLFPNNAKIIYLDYGSSTYASRQSFNELRSSYVIKKKLQPVTCDTMVHLKISGVRTDEVTSNISSQPNPITAFGTVLAKLESRASHYELANIKVVNEGNMFPTSLEVDILVNSYSVESLTEYLNDRGEAFLDKYEDDFPDIEYTYEVVNDESRLPEKRYSDRMCQTLNNMIYAFNNGTYRFDEEDDIPSDYSEGEVYGINSLEQLVETDSSICLDICTQALTNAYLEKIETENKTIADFSKCDYVRGEKVENFYDTDTGFYNILNLTYFKVNDVISRNMIIKDKIDHYFTPCSYLQDINEDMDIIHLSMNEDSVKLITNTILCYIDSLGNFLSL